MNFCQCGGSLNSIDLLIVSTTITQTHTNVYIILLHDLKYYTQNEIFKLLNVLSELFDIFIHFNHTVFVRQ